MGKLVQLKEREDGVENLLRMDLEGVLLVWGGLGSRGEGEASKWREAVCGLFLVVCGRSSGEALSEREKLNNFYIVHVIRFFVSS